MRRLLLLLPLLAGLTALAQPAPGQNNPPPPAEAPPLTTRIRGLFDFDLPTIDTPGTVKLTLHPHFGDLLRRDYMRVDTGLRWAVNDHLEISPEAAVYFTHGFRGNGGYGIGELRLGAKYILTEWPKSDFETSLFINVDTPVGDPPVTMTDGLHHIAPGFIVQHHAARNQRFTTFAGAGFDLITESDIVGTPALNQPRDHAVNLTAGTIYDLGWIKWTLTATYATTAVLGDSNEHFFHLRPGFLWYVPRKYTFNSKTQWILGLGARASWGPDGSQFSTNSRVRAEITFRQFMHNVRNRGTPSESKER